MALVAVSSKQSINRRKASRDRKADFLEALIFLSATASIGLFIADGGLVKFTRFPDAINGLGIIFGLVGSDLLLVMLILAGRVTFLDRVFGHDKLLALHRKLGKPVFYLLVAHMVALLIGYGIGDKLGVIDELFSMFKNLSDILLATIGIMIFAVVIVTSLVIVRRKLPYEFWFTVHLLTYAATIVALPHQFTNGQLFAEGKVSRPFWMALFVGTFAVITIYRVIIPVARSLRHDLRVSAVRMETEDVVTLTFTGRSLDKFPGVGGQFMNWRFWQGNMFLKSHPFSFSAAPSRNSLRITVRNLGKHTKQMQNLKVGTRVSFEGPYGRLTEFSRTKPAVVLVGSGIGITPICALLGDPKLNNADITVILRGSSPESVYLQDEIEKLCILKNAKLHVLVGNRPDRLRTWLSKDAVLSHQNLSTLAPNLKNSDVYVCGPKPWMDLVSQDAKRHGVPKAQIHMERFDI